MQRKYSTRPELPRYGLSRKRRLVDAYRGPILRVRLPDGREVDVYDDDPEIEVPAGALRMAELEAASGGGDVHLTGMPYNQVPPR